MMTLPGPAPVAAVAKKYANAPTMGGPDEIAAWRRLARYCSGRAEYLKQRRVAVTLVEAQNPYASNEAMLDDIDAGLLTVSTANAEHPLWSPEEQIAFRIVHDVDGHYGALVACRPFDFSYYGEYHAYLMQGAMMPVDWNAHLALYTEVVGQAAHYLHYGSFGIQKVAFL